jgi:hypothetical protein
MEPYDQDPNLGGRAIPAYWLWLFLVRFSVWKTR